MNASTQRSDLPEHRPADEAGVPVAASESLDSRFDELSWQESADERQLYGAGGRKVLATALIVLATAWIAYCAWAAGRSLADQSIASPALAQWVALAATPLALLGLVWIMFGRTRRKEAERFTRTVVAMRSEARSLEALLAVLTQRLADSQQQLGEVAQRLVDLGDETSSRLGAVTRDLEESSLIMGKHSLSLDRAAEAARNDVAVLLEDLPRAELSARAVSDQLRSIGGQASERTADFEDKVNRLANAAGDAESLVAEAAQRLVAHLTHIESAGAAAAARVKDSEAELATSVDTLLRTTGETLEQIGLGIHSHSQAVNALVEQASAGIGLSSGDAGQALGKSVAQANEALETLSARLVEQERICGRITTETTDALAQLDRHFVDLADRGNERAAAFVASIGAVREQLQRIGEEAGSQDSTLDTLAERTGNLRDAIGQLAAEVREQLLQAIGQSEEGAGRLLVTAGEIRPEIEWVRDAAVEASDRLSASGADIAGQQDGLAALLAAIDEGVGDSRARLAGLAESIAEAQLEAQRLTRETGPELLAAMVQVREAAGHAAERARSAIASIIPESASQLSAATRDALEKTLTEEVEARLREVETVASKALESARSASQRLTQQMLSLGQSASALERHVEQTEADQRERDSEAFARRVSLLIEAMHSAAIDVGKILSDEIDERAWDSYLRGNRGVFTRRAVRLLDGSEVRAIRSQYESDGEFQHSVNRYVSDFEAMLRRVLAERDGGIIAVTLMSSDMGKLYAALAQAVEPKTRSIQLGL